MSITHTICQGIYKGLRASPTDSLRFYSHVESSPHVESHFFNYIPTNFLFYLYFYYFILTFFFFSFFISLFFFVSLPQWPTGHTASLLNPLDSHPSSKTNKNHHQSTTLLPKSTRNPTIQKIHLPNPSTHSNLPIKPTKNHLKSNQIMKPRSSSTQAEIGAPHQAEIGAPPQAEIGTPHQAEIGASTKAREKGRKEN